MIKIILLPGLHGTDDLFSDIAGYLSDSFLPVPVSYPEDIPMTYDELYYYVKERLPENEDYFLLAESFSGPLAIRIASENPQNLHGLILAATFMKNPIPKIFAKFPLKTLLKIPPTNLLIKLFLAGRDCPESFLNKLENIWAAMDKEVLGRRIIEIANVDESENFKKIKKPILYIRAAFDNLIYTKNSAEMKKINNNIRMIPVDSAHLVLQKQALLCSKIIKNFCKEYKK